MEKGKIYTICKLPGRVPYATNISTKLENLQTLVGGYIEAVNINTDAAILVNEEGRINGMEYNCTYCGLDLYGPAYFVGVDSGEFVNFPMRSTEFKKLAPELWEVV